MARGPTFLKEWRKHRKLTLEAASQRAGMTAGNLSAMERGTQGYTQAGLEALSQVYECEPGQLLSTHPNLHDHFRHPDEDWLVRFFHDRTSDEIERMKRMLEAGFPPKSKRK